MQKNNILVSGFTFIKNGLTLGYPIKESIQSIAPLCDEIIINVGFDDSACTQDDGTFAYLKDHFPSEKFKFLKSFWDPALMHDGLILSQQTNIALRECRGSVCQYIQGDEVLHQDDLLAIEKGIKELIQNEHLEGLVFNYLHFYGNVDTYKYTRNIYRREVRTIKNNRGLLSFKDAQGFRKVDGAKMLAKLIDARIFHYGWARNEAVMKNKVIAMDKLYHGEQKNTGTEFKYTRVYGLKKFQATHPLHMQAWVEKNKNDLDIMAMKPDFKLKHYNLALSDLFEDLTGIRIGEFKNYKLL